MACTKGRAMCSFSIPREIHNTVHVCPGLKTNFTNMYLTWPIHVPSASPFPITNIPFGIFSTQDSVSASQVNPELPVIDNENLVAH